MCPTARRRRAASLQHVAHRHLSVARFVLQLIEQSHEIVAPFGGQ